MSHKLFHHSNLSNARVWDFLKQVDAAEAESSTLMSHSGSALNGDFQHCLISTIAIALTSHRFPPNAAERSWRSSTPPIPS